METPYIYPDAYVTNPIHGGKVTCHKCNGFILERELVREMSSDEPFHIDCFNVYEHYYGLDKPID